MDPLGSEVAAADAGGWQSPAPDGDRARVRVARTTRIDEPIQVAGALSTRYTHLPGQRQPAGSGKTRSETPQPPRQGDRKPSDESDKPTGIRVRRVVLPWFLLMLPSPLWTVYRPTTARRGHTANCLNAMLDHARTDAKQAVPDMTAW